jgi:hypothetical protein
MIGGVYTALRIGFPSEAAIVLGAFQRAGDAPEATLRRPSGGGVVRIGPGTLWMQLALTLEELPAEKLVNRHVRPLLKALTKATSKPVSYFGRDWISLAHHPVGFVGFAHDASKGEGLLEAVVAVDEPFVPAPRPSFLGKAPKTLGVARDRVLAEVTAAYGLASSGAPNAKVVVPEPPWTATQEEAIGLVAAGRDAYGRIRIGGEFMASSDAVAKLEAALALPGIDVDRAIDEAFTTGGATIFGVRSLASIRAVIVTARAR